MTLLQIRTLAKKYADDPDEDLFSSTEYDESINEAYRALFAFINKLHSSFARKVATGTIASGETTLTYPTDMLSVYRFGVRTEVNTNFSKIEFFDYEKDGEPYNDGNSGKPEFAAIDMINIRFDIFPKTDQAYLYQLIYRRKLVVADEMSGDGDTPSLIPIDYHRWIAQETAMDAMTSNDRKTNKVERLQQKLEARMRSEFAKLQQATPQHLKGWNGDDVEING